MQVDNILEKKLWVIKNHNQTKTVFQDNNQYYLSSGMNINVYESKQELENMLGLPLPDTNNQKSTESSAFGYPTKCVPHESLYDLKNKRPIFRKSNISVCYYCAGYYMINIKRKWVCCFCPKLSLVEQSQSFGPYTSEEQALKEYKNEQSRTT